jgi:PAS domain S-box-containing protein
MSATDDVARLGAILEDWDDAIFSHDSDGSICAWSRGAERMYGYPADEVVGRSPGFLLAGDSLTNGSSLFDRALGGERVQHVETEHRRRDGLPVPVSLTIAPIRDAEGNVVGTTAVARDISEARHAQATLAASEARLNEGEALSHVGTWTFDVASGAMQWSAELHRITGIEPVDFGGTIDDHLAAVHDGDRDLVAKLISTTLATTDPFEVTHRLQRNGELRHIYMRGTAVNDGAGTVIGVRGIAQDVTEQHRANDAIRAAYDREHAAAEELRVAAAMKDDFLSIVSHELRTPLTSIIGFTALLDQVSESDRADVVERIASNAAEMQRMVERLLDLTRLQHGGIQLDIAALPLRGEVQRRVHELNGVLKSHIIRIAVPHDVTVDADKDALSHVVTNLLTNAAKFSPPGTTIHVDSRRDGSDVVVMVSDEGAGVAPEMRDKVFDQFFQASASRGGQHGAGVGLSIVRKYVELHGGRAWCESEPGHGATFLFTLPASAA